MKINQIRLIKNATSSLMKYNMQPSDWPVYRDLVMMSPYDDVIIHKLQYGTTGLVEHTGGEGGRGRGADKPSQSGARRKKKKNKNKKRKMKNEFKIKAKQIQKRKNRQRN